ncbi:hypothetical protein SAMN05661096_02994 [Marivirga sericea]|uniref:Uncharacterized protein n=1 Tax=Marivirga sericea TaxID=1028 RepID=A0A1X7KQ25_9BACT|nr:hypothetical protein [Marivirga sericea]SMG43224.1 hypothetical protein SAMN05661096_02994 [Marivirga sericea]
METQSIEQSQRINLGAGNVKFSESTIRKSNYFLGALFMIMALLYLFRDSIGVFEKIGMSGLYFSTGFLFLFKAQIELSQTSKYAPHFVISEHGLKIKTGVFKKSNFINWNNIRKIELGYYKIGIKDKGEMQYFTYQTRKETSIELKRLIEAIAAQKGVEVENLLKK